MSYRRRVGRVRLICAGLSKTACTVSGLCTRVTTTSPTQHFRLDRSFSAIVNLISALSLWSHKRAASLEGLRLTLPSLLSNNAAIIKNKDCAKSAITGRVLQKSSQEVHPNVCQINCIRGDRPLMTKEMYCCTIMNSKIVKA